MYQLTGMLFLGELLKHVESLALEGFDYRLKRIGRGCGAAQHECPCKHLPVAAAGYKLNRRRHSFCRYDKLAVEAALGGESVGASCGTAEVQAYALAAVGYFSSEVLFA